MNALTVRCRVPAAAALRLAPGIAFGMALLMTASANALADDRPTLTVYTYSSFDTEWGPGPQIKSGFEEICGCTVSYVAVDDGVALLSRMRLEGPSTNADVVLGLDMNLIAEARELDLLIPHGQQLDDLDLPIDWSDDVFVPFDWGYFAFVYDSQSVETPPASLRALVEESDLELLIQDPRTSTPGLGLLLWVKAVYGDDAGDAWAVMRDRIVTVTSGWSEAYGLFQEGEAPLVLSYSTSPAYHIVAEETDRYRAAAFDEGHYMQIEVAAATNTSDHPELARSFLEYLTSEDAQSILPVTNWMYPVRNDDVALPAAFDNLIHPSEALLFDPETVRDNRSDWVDEWLDGMSR
ncbi:thiamine ABC transporter substrate binding subunit [Fodinicurvata sp. EGI_FJ10296]|uniref:thiamine ABC transporter substrate binding subunit n=1 Tax=Fodinicurvata sp. EGI_FJ10296 TaxID=3231908 RepID=UPI003454F009